MSKYVLYTCDYSMVQSTHYINVWQDYQFDRSLLCFPLSYLQLEPMSITVHTPFTLTLLGEVNMHIFDCVRKLE